MSQENKVPLIVGFVSDLMFAVRIENAAREKGLGVEWIAAADDLVATIEESDENRPGEPLSGRAGTMFTRLAEWQPVLVIFDLANDEIPWRRWIAAIKSSPATRRIPIVCYGPHVAEETLATARSLGADLVVPRSRFSSNLGQIITDYSREDRSELSRDACREPIADLARKGISLFNQGKYYECHDYLEEAWVEDEGPGRELYRAILQVGISYFQIERGNFRGAVKMLLRVRQWLQPLPEICRGVDVGRLVEDVENVHAALLELGPDGMEQLDRNLFRPIVIHER